MLINTIWSFQGPLNFVMSFQVGSIVKKVVCQEDHLPREFFLQRVVHQLHVKSRVNSNIAVETHQNCENQCPRSSPALWRSPLDCGCGWMLCQQWRSEGWGGGKQKGGKKPLESSLLFVVELAAVAEMLSNSSSSNQVSSVMASTSVAAAPAPSQSRAITS